MEMVEVNTAELTGAALDLAVASTQDSVCPVIIGGKIYHDTDWDHIPYSPSTDWAQGGPLLNELMETGKWEIVQSVTAGEFAIQNFNCECIPVDGNDWSADSLYFSSDSILVAACRAVVFTKFGGVVNVPATLVYVIK